MVAGLRRGEWAPLDADEMRIVQAAAFHERHRRECRRVRGVIAQLLNKINNGNGHLVDGGLFADTECKTCL